MTRKAVSIGLPYLLGLFLCDRLSVCWYGFLGILPLLLFLGLGCRLRLKQLLLCGISFAFACCLYCGYMYRVRDALLAYGGQTVSLTGRVENVDVRHNEQASYLIRTNMGGHTTRITYYGADLICQYGDSIRMTAVLAPYEDTYLFPAVSYYQGKGSFLQVQEASDVEIIPERNWSLVGSIRAYADRICAKIRMTLPKQEAGLLCAMLLGDKSGLDSPTKTALYRLGIGHVTAVSGLHLTLLCSLVGWILRRLRLGKRLAFCIQAVVAVGFVLCTGVSHSACRAAVMLLLVYSGDVFHRQSDPLNALCIAVLALTGTRPYLIGSASFLLSAAGVFAVAVAAPWLTAHFPVDTLPKRILKGLAASSVIPILLMPLCACYFQEASLLSPLSNFLVLPLCMAAMLCGLGVFLTGGWSVAASPLLQLAGFLCRTVLEIGSWCAGLHVGVVPLGGSYVLPLCLLSVLLALCVFGFRREQRRVWASIGLTVMLFWNVSLFVSLLEQNTLKIAMLGKGNACTLVITCGDQTDVLDLTGGGAGAEYVSRYLQASGISRVETLVLDQQQYRAMAAFHDALPYVQVHWLLVPEDTYHLPGSTVCGTVPEPFSIASAELLRSQYTIRFLGTGTVEILYAGRRVLCAAGTEPLTESDVRIQYGAKLPETMTAGYLLTTAPCNVQDGQVYAGQNNLCISIDAQGGISIQELMKGG